MYMTLFLLFIYTQIGAGFWFFFYTEEDYKKSARIWVIFFWPFMLAVIYAMLLNEKKIENPRRRRL